MRYSLYSCSLVTAAMALVLIGASVAGGATVDTADDAVVKDSGDDFDPLAGTQRILRLLKDAEPPRPRVAETNTSSSPVVRRHSVGGGMRLLQAALARIGAPYVWGGATSDGFDCSGLVLNIARQFGLRLPHSAAEQANYGEVVLRDSLAPGDLVFFANTYKPGISHVGVYKGGNQFVHASSGSGKVSVSSLRHPYYASRYAGARRLSVGSE